MHEILHTPYIWASIALLRLKFHSFVNNNGIVKLIGIRFVFKLTCKNGLVFRGMSMGQMSAGLGLNALLGLSALGTAPLCSSTASTAKHSLLDRL